MSNVIIDELDDATRRRTGDDVPGRELGREVVRNAARHVPMVSLPDSIPDDPKDAARVIGRHVLAGALAYGAQRLVKKIPDWYRQWKDDGEQPSVNIDSEPFVTAITKFLNEENGEDKDRMHFKADTRCEPSGWFVSVVAAPTKEHVTFDWDGHSYTLYYQEEHVEYGGQSVPIEKGEYTLQALEGGKDALVKLLKAVAQWTRDNNQNDNTVSTHIRTPYGWHRMNQKTRRPIDSVVLEQGVKENILSDVRRFLDSKDYYIKHGIPYRRGYLLYGPPGTGKSSFVGALAGEIESNLYMINMSSGYYNDNRLATAFRETNPGSIILLEDIDTLFEARNQTDDNESKVTFQGLLNVLDGPMAQEGRMVFMTTNRKDKLDSALIRDGRADVKTYIGKATQNQVRRMFLKFYPGEEARAKRFARQFDDREVTPAQLQNHFIEYRDKPHAALQHADLI